MAQQIQIRRDIATNWSSANPILAQGEMGLETNTLKVKFGDGTTAWNSLAYFGNTVKELTDVTLTSLASGNVLIANASGIFINQSLSSLVNELVSFASLGSLAFRSTLSSSDVGLGNVTNDAQLKIASNLSDLNNATIARTNLSLGSLAVVNSVPVYTLPSTVSSNEFYGNNGLFASQVSIQNLNGAGLYFQGGIISGFQTTTATVGGQLFTNGGIVNASTVSTQTLNVAQDIVAPNVDTFRSFYGTGADGIVTLDGSLNSRGYSFASLSASTYTLTRDVYATTFTVANTYTVKTSGYRIFATEYILNNGTIENNGNPGVGTTAGTGGAGGFFRAGGNGATGLLSASAGAVGAFPPLPGAGVNLVGKSGGRGAGGRAGVTTFTGTNVALASLSLPASTIGGRQLVYDPSTYFKALIASSTTANVQIQPSLGGGSGAKSIIGTTATSGAGGGGGGFIFLSSPSIVNNSFIQSQGGAGGNAGGTGGVFGGGGGGAGGIIAYVTRKSAPSITVDVSGGLPGLSAGNTNTINITKADSTFVSNATIQYVTFTPAQTLSNLTFYMMSILCTYDAGTFAGINAGAVSGFGCAWIQEKDIRFSTLANPTRALFVFRGVVADSSTNYLNDNRIKILFADPVNSVRVILDEIQNHAVYNGNPEIEQTADFTSDSSNNPLTVLGTAPVTNNTQYSVIARAGGTALTAGTGGTLVNNQTTAPLLASMVAVSRITSNASYTTAGAVAMTTFDLGQAGQTEDGTSGWDGEVIRFNV